jgi:host factor-I protein
MSHPPHDARKRPPRDGGGPPPPRRAPPPDHTGAEARYLLELKDKKTPLVVCLNDGETVRGWIEYYDRDMVKINRHAGPNLFIRKIQIRYFYEDDGGA